MSYNPTFAYEDTGAATDYDWVETSKVYHAHNAPTPPVPPISQSSEQSLTPIFAETPVAVDNVDALNGYIDYNGRLRCRQSECARRAFRRQQDLKRHYETTHDVNKVEFWCPVATCKRSQSATVKYFSRKDTLKDHIRRMHPEVTVDIDASNDG